MYLLRQLRYLLPCFALAVHVPAVWAADSPPATPEIRVLIDVSGSMKKTDPQNLRAPALRLLVDLLPGDTLAGVWTFAGQPVLLVPPMPVDARWREDAAQASNRIHSRGLFTNIEAAVRAATSDWLTPNPGGRKTLLLLTDGVVDVAKDTALSAVSRARILEPILPELKAAGIKVGAIALSKDADHLLLRRLAAGTDGWYEQAETAEALQRLFLRMVENAAPADALPLTANRFTVDEHVKEMTIVVFRRAGAPPARITTPDGKELTSEDVGPKVRWRSEAGYDLVTVEGPAAGEWQILADMDPDNRVKVVTDVTLETTELPRHLLPNEPVTYRAHLNEQGRTLDDAAFLELVSMRLARRRPDGDGVTWTLRDDGANADETAADGKFAVAFDNARAEEGAYEWVLTADGGTFRRQRRQTVNIQWPVELTFAAVEGDEKSGINIRLVPRLEYLDPRSLDPVLRVVNAVGIRRVVPLERGADNAWQAYLEAHDAPDERAVEIEVFARSALGDKLRFEMGPIPLGTAPVTTVAEPEPPAPPPATPEPEPAVDVEVPERTNWTMVSIAAGLINLVVFAGAFFLYRWWQTRTTAELDALGSEPA